MTGQPCLVCPLFRRDPLCYAPCAHLQLKRVKDVKEHLLFRHARPLHSEGGVVIEGLDEEQIQKLQECAKRGKTLEEQWTVVDTVCHPKADKLPAGAAFLGDDYEEVARTMAEHFNKSSIALLPLSPHQRQMVRAGIEGFWSGFSPIKAPSLA